MILMRGEYSMDTVASLMFHPNITDFTVATAVRSRGMRGNQDRHAVAENIGLEAINSGGGSLDGGKQ